MNRQQLGPCDHQPFNCPRICGIELPRLFELHMRAFHVARLEHRPGVTGPGQCVGRIPMRKGAPRVGCALIESTASRDRRAQREQLLFLSAMQLRVSHGGARRFPL